jgi:N-methylhydantoinase A/oxoprolinase/acetone carboxylase beta subunit
MIAALDLRLGIDVGSTNTDAVVVDRNDRVLVKAKTPTSIDVTRGIATAIELVITELGDQRARITHAMLGTTHAMNAVIERRDLRRVAVLRIGGPATRAVPPLATWPTDLRDAVVAGATVVDGGIELDGSEIAPLDLDAAARFFDALVGYTDAVAITSVFSSVSDRHELAAEELARAIFGEVPVSLSHEIGTIGLLERENATVFNAALGGLAEHVADAFGAALGGHGLDPAKYIAQNDGTLMAFEHALSYPVLTMGCGPANSLRGAARLSDADDALVADVGGTSTEIGPIVGGFPCESEDVVCVAGVRTNFRMPSLVTMPLGGGTIIGNGAGTLGPASVGYRLERETLVFGGATATLTDAAVAAGRIELGDHPLPRASREPLIAALRRSDELLAEAVDRAKIARSEPVLVVVGGAGFLVPEDLAGVAEVRRPEHHEVANAIGAAIAQVGGQVERIVHPGVIGRRAALESVFDEARSRAVRAGADPDRLQIVEVEEVPLAYLTDPAIRIRVKAVGPLALT